MTICGGRQACRRGSSWTRTLTTISLRMLDCRRDIPERFNRAIRASNSDLRERRGGPFDVPSEASALSVVAGDGLPLGSRLSRRAAIFD